MTVAEQIAELLKQNKLMTAPSAKDIYPSHYLLRMDGATVQACAKAERVSWYQWELRHLSVHPEHQRKGLASALIQQAIVRAREANGLLLQATVTADNTAMLALLGKLGWTEGARFANPSTERVLTVWQLGLQ
jgi:GNAT superfamily N-acetyltransferase